jgi:DamX protein
VAVSELHRRLDYLVAYSSQLIFVSGESLSQQQKALQGFIAQQHENTEVAFLNGEPTNSDRDYREQIMLQLLDNPAQRNTQSLAHLTQYLNGQVLICICSAQHLSNQILQELWDLVIHCRESQGTVHLNVVLFGESDWAAKAKQWLPERNQDKPVLLSNEIIEENVQPESDLERLIAQKREQFAQRLAKRNQPTEKTTAVIQTLWFKIFVSAVFVLTFAAILAWQYPQTIPFYSTDTESVQEIQSAQEINSPPTQETLDTPTESEALSTVATSDSEESQELDDQRPVADWNEAVKKAQSKQTAETLDAETVQEQSAIIENSGTDVDQKGIELTTPETDTIEQSDNVVAAEKLNPLMDLAPSQYVIQLSAMSSKALADAFVKQNMLDEKHWRYTTIRFGGDWYVIVYQAVFESIEEAQTAVEALPPSLKALRPFVKSVKQVQEEIALADPS